MADLITLARAKEAISQTSFTSAEDDAIDNLIDAVSAAIANHLHRDLSSNNFDEVYLGTNRVLILDHYPVTQIDTIRTRRKEALRVSNSSSSNQRATARVTASGLHLSQVASGVVTNETEITWSANATIEDVKDAVIAKGNGWNANVVNAFQDWDSDELSPARGRFSQGSDQIEGAFAAKDQWAAFHVWTDELSGYETQPGNGTIILVMPFSQKLRVKYTAGYGTIPEDVQEAAAEWVALLFNADFRRRKPTEQFTRLRPLFPTQT